MSELKLLTTCEIFNIENQDQLSESVDKEGNIILKGILQKADTLNQNGRVYPKAILQREIRNYQKFITENRSLGELDHPDTSVVSLKNVSHLVTEARMDDDGIVWGSIKLLNTPAGQTLSSLVKSKVKLGISSRGVGSTKKQGDYQVVQDDFQLICWDMVSEPSTPGAFMIPEGKTISRTELEHVFNRSDRINRIVTEILNKEPKC